jgi:hypothetical protein
MMRTATKLGPFCKIDNSRNLLKIQAETKTMKKNQFPQDWDEKRV